MGTWKTITQLGPVGEKHTAEKKDVVNKERQAVKRELAMIAERREHKEWQPGTVEGVQPWGIFVESSRIAGAQGALPCLGKASDGLGR